MNKDEEEKRNVLLQLMKWLNSMNADFKISLANEYRNSTKFLEEVLPKTNEKRYPEIAKGITEWLQEKIQDGNPDVKRVMYLVITCHARSIEEARIYFNAMDAMLQRVFASWGSRIEKLNEEQRLKSLSSFFHMSDGESFVYRPELKIRDSWRNSVLPVSIKAVSYTHLTLPTIA